MIERVIPQDDKNIYTFLQSVGCLFAAGDVFNLDTTVIRECVVLAAPLLGHNWGQKSRGGAAWPVVTLSETSTFPGTRSVKTLSQLTLS